MAGEHFSAQKRVTWIPESFSEMFHCGTSNFSDFDFATNDLLTSCDPKSPSFDPLELENPLGIQHYLHATFGHVIILGHLRRDSKSTFYKS